MGMAVGWFKGPGGDGDGWAKLGRGSSMHGRTHCGRRGEGKKAATAEGGGGEESISTLPVTYTSPSAPCMRPTIADTRKQSVFVAIFDDMESVSDFQLPNVEFPSHS